MSARIPYFNRANITEYDLDRLKLEIVKLQALAAKNKPLWHPMTELPPKEGRAVFAMLPNGLTIVTFYYTAQLKSIFISSYIAWIEREKILP